MDEYVDKKIMNDIKELSSVAVKVNGPLNDNVIYLLKQAAFFQNLNNPCGNWIIK